MQLAGRHRRAHVLVRRQLRLYRAPASQATNAGSRSTVDRSASVRPSRKILSLVFQNTKSRSACLGTVSYTHLDVYKRQLDDLALGVLAKHRAQVDDLADGLKLEVRPDGFMFSRSPVGAEPMQPDFVSKFAKKVATKAGVDTHLHALRHFSATQAIAAGFDPTTVAGRLGHRDSSITLRVYSHVLEGRDRDLAEALGKTLALPG